MYLSSLKLLVSLVLVAGFLQADAQANNYTLEQADSLFMQYNLAASHQAYLQIAESDQYSDSIRVKAYENLANQSWRFYVDYQSAVQWLQSAKKFNVDLYGIDLLAATINQQAHKYTLAKPEAEESLRLAKSDLDKINAEIEYARIVNDENFNKQTVPLNYPDLKKASLMLDNILQKQPGNSDASELLIGVSLLLKDGAGALKGWQSYYLVSNEHNINQALRTGYQKLKPVLVNWHGTTLTVAQMKTLSIGFGETKFFNYANFFADAVKRKDAKLYARSLELKDLAAYYTYINNVQQVNDTIYPAVARGKVKYEDEYDSLMNNAGKKLWGKLSFTDKKAKFDPDTFYNVMNRHFGMKGYSGYTVNYYGMLMGHIIHNEPKQITQYGYSTKFTYISVDRLISRDFTSWYGTTNVGGWGDSSTIIQVRKAYMTEPFELLNWMTDPKAKAKVLADIAQKKQADYALCKNDPYAEPKFLALYLKFNEASKIYKHLTDSGLRGMALNIAFIDEIFRLTIASTIFAHEGRHAIDQLYFPAEFKAMSDDERELRAKYSEVIYSLNPKMAFTGSIMGSGLDENTNHGKANKRFRKVIVDWMTTHEAEISGLDKNIPLLMQFDLLTDVQLIAICQSGDPLAKARRKI